MTPNNEPVAGGGSTELLVLVGTPSPATIIPTAIPPVDFDSPLSVSERAASFKSEPDIFDTSSVLSEVSTDTPDADDTMLYESNMAEPVAGTDNLTNQTPSDLDLISNTPTPTKTGPRSRKVRGKGSNILSGLTITMNDLPDKPRHAPPPPSSTPKPTAPPKYRASLHLSFFASDMDTSGTRVVRRGPGRPRKDALRRVDMMKVQVKEIKQQMQREYYEAARGSRLMYTVMSPQEKEIFGRALRYLQLPVYLNIRNGILRLWLQNPRVPLTLDQAMRVKRDHGYSAKYDHLLRAVYEFLVRYGYINFGYLSPIQTPTLPLSRLHLGLRNDPRQKTVVVVGAGMAGIACARQLHLLFAHFAPAFAPHPPPAIVVVEARGRIGGRVFSYPLHTQAPMQFECVLRAENKAVVFPRRPAGIDLGAQIITGFDGGNPMEVVVKKQLRLPLHPLMSNYCHLHDAKGERVSDETDRKCDEMFNEVLDLACGLKRDTRGWSEDLVEFLLTRGDARGEGVEKTAVPTVKREEVVEDWGLLEAGTPLSEAEGDRDTQDGSEVSSALSSPPPESVNGDAIGRDAIERAGVDAAETWRLKGMVVPTLGNTMDYFFETHPEFRTLTEREIAVVHWHYANLEFANATPLDRLSLDHWDQDDGYEFHGDHAMVVGGYGQVPHAIALGPTPLDIRLRKPVQAIRYNGSALNGAYPVRIECRDGEVVQADAVVVTTPLGVLKAGDVTFEPELPEWKRDAMERIGFGNLNKLVLVFPRTFWDTHADMFGAVAAPNDSKNEYHPKTYSDTRGQFYMFWNCVAISGLPVLIGLMAGTSANMLESNTDAELTQQALSILARLHPSTTPLPSPLETIVTRWSRDEFARGSYSYVGPRASGDDYDALSRPVGDTLFFAGEATARHYPATVHGAYISGVRAAQEVADLWLGRMAFANRRALFEGIM